ncbi:hypothetical protein KAH94_00450 [bacterium]|nr:hypothetical protein [bacterium]
MKKQLFLTLFLTISILSTPAISASEPKKDVVKKIETSKDKSLSGTINKIKALLPFLKLGQEFVQPILEGFGLKDLAKAVDKAVIASSGFIKESERKEGPRIGTLIDLYAQMQEASALLTTDLEKIIVTLAKPLKLLSPLIVGPLKLFVKDKDAEGNKIIVIKGKDAEGNPTREEIKVEKFAEMLPEVIIEKIFSFVKAYEKVLSKLLKAYIDAKEKIENAKDKVNDVKNAIIKVTKEIIEEENLSPDVKKALDDAKEKIENIQKVIETKIIPLKEMIEIEKL